jgi:glycosyltransferase involved in cell wall biosynthesis
VCNSKSHTATITAGESVKITAFVHFSVPYRMAGSETMLHTMLTSLAEAGHQVSCVTSDMEAPKRWDWGPVKGISVSGLGAGEAAVIAEKPDVVISHHQNSIPSIHIARGIGAKSVFIQHNSFPDNSAILKEKPDLVVFNTQWIANLWKQHTRKHMVVHPPVWPEEHATHPGDHVTMINLNRDKGVLVFYQMAKRFPKHKFLGVIGSHGPQMIPRSAFPEAPSNLEIKNYPHIPSNVTIMKPTTNMKQDVWSRTRVLLVPSVYESYGMVAVEALASGIPVIATPTPGLRESLGMAGIFANRNQIGGWAYHLKLLVDNPVNWKQTSKRCLARSSELDPRPELTRWVAAVEEL